MPVSIPNPLTDGTTAYGSQVKANDDALAAKFTEGAGGIADADIASAAAIKGSKLSSVAGSRVPSDRIEDDAVTFDKLRDDATVDANRAVGTNHIRDLSIPKQKLSTTPTATISKAQTSINIATTTTVVANGAVVLFGSGVVKSGRTLIGLWLRTVTGGSSAGPLIMYEDVAGSNFQAQVSNQTGASVTCTVVFVYMDTV